MSERGVFEVYDAVVALGGSPPYAKKTLEMRRAFEERAGAFGPNDPWFEARSRAFWDDALTRQRFARDVLADLDASMRDWALAFERAHRGLFRASTLEGKTLFVDVWGGAEFVIDTTDEGSREALHAATGLFDARLVAKGSTVAMLPGALFHPEDATAAIEAVLGAARSKPLETDGVLDALLRMERRLRSLSRVKAAYAYRIESL